MMISGPSFVIFSIISNTFNINPTKSSDVGVWKVTGSINDAVVSVSFSFTVIVINTAPYFTTALED